LKLNIIQIVSDTFRRDHLGCYGNKWIHTEHLDRFAKEAMVFDRAYIASFPTIPHRRDIFTGRYAFTYSRWIFGGEEPNLPRDEAILSQLLRQAGYTTMLIVDTYHMIRDAHYFDRGFDGWWWIRGQEGDRYMTKPTEDSAERKKAFGAQYLRNVSSRLFEEDYFVAQTMAAATRWLELNYDQHEKFFLHVDTFDPHEPWDPPRWYADMYYPDWKGREVMGGAYVPDFKRVASNLKEDELNYLRALYAGEVTLVDRWTGMLLQKIEDLGLLEDTAVIFTTDHGTYLGEHGYIGKRNHLYEEVTRIPLIIRFPDSEGAPDSRCGEIVQSPELMPTILELAGVNPPPPTVQAKSFLPMIRNEVTREREFAVSSFSLMTPIKSHPWITVTSKEWALLALAGGSDLPPQDELGRKIEPELYHLPTDPNQTKNLYKEKIEVAEELRSKMIGFLKSTGTKEEILREWL